MCSSLKSQRSIRHTSKRYPTYIMVSKTLYLSQQKLLLLSLSWSMRTFYRPKYHNFKLQLNISLPSTRSFFKLLFSTKFRINNLYALFTVPKPQTYQPHSLHKYNLYSPAFCYCLCRTSNCFLQNPLFS